MTASFPLGEPVCALLPATCLERSAAVIELDAATLARAVREQKALPITQAEAEELARSLEEAGDEAEFLASTVAAMRFLADRLDRSIGSPP